MRNLIAAVVSVVTLIPCVFAEVTALQCGKLVDVQSRALLDAKTIIVEGDKISSVDDGIHVPEGARIVNLKDSTCMPGLMDMHVHLTSQYSAQTTIERFSLNSADCAIRAVVNAKKTLLAGFTTVRDPGSDRDTIIALRNAVNAGAVPGGPSADVSLMTRVNFVMKGGVIYSNNAASINPLNWSQS